MQFGRNDPNILKPTVLQWLSGLIDRMAGQSWRRHPLQAIIRAVRRDCLGLKQSRGEVDDLGTTAGTVVSGHEMVADQQREGKHAPGLDVVLVGAEGAEELAQILHALVVDTSQALGNRGVAPRPVAHGEIDRQQRSGEGQPTRLAQLDPGVAALAFDALDNLPGAHPLPGVEHLREQRTPVGEVPVEAALAHPKGSRKGLDPNSVWPAGGERPQPLIDPAVTRRAGDGDHGSSVSGPGVDSAADGATVQLYGAV